MTTSTQTLQTPAEMIEERTKANPDFPALVEAALNRRELLRALAAERQAAGITQTELAAALGTSQAQVARLESASATSRAMTPPNTRATRKPGTPTMRNV